jgi:hydrogenase maturation protease
MTPKVLVAGIGNIFAGDDGFGVAVAQHLLAQSVPQGVQVTDFGIRGYDLAFALMEPWERVILIDAVARGGDPGTVYTIEPQLNQAEEELATADLANAHGMDPSQVLRMVMAMGGTVPPLTLVACEPADLGGEEGRLGLTPVVQASMNVAVEIIEQLLEHFLKADSLTCKVLPMEEQKL